jgi:hypothetical protein
MMRQAGRYLREYRALREKAGSKRGRAIHIDTGTILPSGMESVVLVIRAGSTISASPSALSISSVSDFAAMLDRLHEVLTLQFGDLSL